MEISYLFLKWKTQCLNLYPRADSYIEPKAVHSNQSTFLPSFHIQKN